MEKFVYVRRKIRFCSSVSGNEPQENAVELAQLGEGDSPKSSVSHETKQELFLGKTVCNIRQKGVPPLLLPASVLQLPRCLVRICNVDSHDLMLFELDSFKNCNCSRKNLLQIQFASQTWATRPHLGSIFEKLLHRKTFVCLRLISCSQLQFVPAPL